MEEAKKEKKKKRFRKRTLLILGILVLGWFSINWFFMYRLESYLNEKLSESIAESTKDFYDFSFDKLSVGFFTGELTVQNVSLEPNKEVYDTWKQGDSLPDTYLKIHIDKIDLKGINLTWRFNYKDLRFGLFELESPQIAVYRERYYEKEVNPTTRVGTMDLYDMIAPYMDEISAERINLKKASVAYTLKDSIVPSVYALKDINLNMHKFLLDKDAYSRGHLLYSEDFDFWVEHPQTILSNGQLQLRADTIRLNTRDSLIQVKGVSVLPQLELWAEIHKIPEDYVIASLKAVELRGIDFSHDGKYNYLSARTFSVDASNVKYFTEKGEVPDVTKSTRQKEKVTKFESLSLYEIISPIFERVAIKDIKLSNSSLQYTHAEPDYKNVYNLGRLDVEAHNFLIDSLYEENIVNKYLYTESIALNAYDIQADMVKQNHKLNIAHLSLSSIDKYARIAGIQASPISKNTKNDYLEGRIAHIAFEGVGIEDGIVVNSLNITNPIIKYSSLPKQAGTGKRLPDKMSKSNVIDIFSPFLNSLSIGEINLINADLELDEKASNNVYNLRNAYASVTNFVIDEHTRSHSVLPFNYSDFTFRFSDYNNHLPGDDYKIQIDKGYLSKNSGHLRIENIKLTPRQRLKDAKKNYLEFSSPLFEMKGAEYDEDKKEFHAKSLELSKPIIQFTKQTEQKAGTTKGGKEKIKFPSFLQHIEIDEIRSDKVHATILNKKKADTIRINTDSLLLNMLSFSEKSLTFGQIRIDTVQIKKNGNTVINFHQVEMFAPEITNLQEPILSMIGANINEVDLRSKNLNLKTDNIDFLATKWNTRKDSSSFDLLSLKTNEPQISIKTYAKEKIESELLVDTKQANPLQSLKATLGGFAKKIDISQFEIKDANINYSRIELDGSTKNEQLKNVNFATDLLWFNAHKDALHVHDIRFDTKRLRYPVGDYYTLDIGEVSYAMQGQGLVANDIKFISTYPKNEFAYKHPTSQDWFNVEVGSVQLKDIDFLRYFKDEQLYVGSLKVDNVLLENLKNQKKEIEHNKMPLIYEELHRLPIKFAVGAGYVNNFNVIYEELPKKGEVPAKLTFTNMDGQLSGLTNIVSDSSQMIRLDATGKLMGTGDFRAEWLMPVSPDNDLFELRAEINDFDMRGLNSLIEPMAPATVESGTLHSLKFLTHATSLGADVSMEFLYNDLEIVIFNNAEDRRKKKLYTRVANKMVKSNNPDKVGKKPRLVEGLVERDPYHSTFNYFWQILQPPLIESVGVSQGKQTFLKRVAESFGRIKNLFSCKKSKTEE